MSGNLVEILIMGKNMSKAAFREAQADGSTMGKVVKEAGVVGAEALVALGVESVRMASEYELATTRLVTSAGEQRANLKLVQDGMLNMAGQVGISANELAKAMYYVEAAGYHGAAGLTVLRAAAQGAVAENADVTHVSQALTDVLVDYHMKAAAAATVTSQMIAAVANGKTNLEDFSKAFASIVPAAAAAGISFPDVSAALAEMTNHGFPAARAAQNLAQALRSLLKPTKPMLTAFAQFGISSDELKAKLHGPNGLTDAMEYISQAAAKVYKIGSPGYVAAMRAMMGTAPGMNAALATTGHYFDATTGTIKAVSGATADASGKVAGFALVQQTFGQQIRQLDAGFQTLLIRVGDQIMPVLSKFISYVMTNGSPILKQLGDVAQQDVVPVLSDFWQILQNLYPVALSVMQVLGVTGYGALVAVSDILKNGILPPLISFTGWLAKNKDLVQAVTIGYLGYKTAALGLEGAIWLVEGATKAWTAAQALLDVALNANPIGVATIAIVAMAGGFYLLYTRSLGVRQAVATVFNNMGAAAGLAAHAVLVALKFVQDAILNLIGFNLDMGAKLFGWVPGIGGQLKKADKDFNNFQASIDDGFNKAIATVDNFNNSMQTATQVKYLQMDIDAWNQKIAAAKQQLASVPASKKASLNADISQWQAKINAAQRQIDSLQGKTVTIDYQGIYTGPAASLLGHKIGFAAGGVVGAAASGGPRGGSVLVGEMGPELVHLPTGSSVTPAGGTRRMLAEAGGAQRLEIEWVGGNAGDQFMAWLRQNIRIRGGNVQAVLGQGY